MEKLKWQAEIRHHLSGVMELLEELNPPQAKAAKIIKEDEYEPVHKKMISSYTILYPIDSIE